MPGVTLGWTTGLGTTAKAWGGITTTQLAKAYGFEIAIDSV